MYSFRVKASATDVEIPAARGLLLTGLLVLLLYRNQNIVAVNIAVALLLLAGAVFTSVLFAKFKINLPIIICVAAVFLMAATRGFAFPVIMLLVAGAVKYYYVSPSVEIADTIITIKKTFSRKQYSWDDFSNIVLKDDLLTLDFKNNKVLQLEVENNAGDNPFNEYCRKKLTAE